MTPRWILQKNIYKEDFDKVVNVVKEFGFKYEAIDVIPFSEYLQLIEPYNGPTIAYGSTTLMRLAYKEWIPGIWFDEDSFRPSEWERVFFHNCLNYGSVILTLRAVLDNWKGDKLFIRPNSDHKLFSGGVFMKGDFYDWYSRVKSLIDSGTYVNLSLDTLVSVAPFKPIDAEWRFFIADRLVIAGSQYRLNGQLKPSININSKALDLAELVATNYWQPAPAYVVDIALSEGEYKIIEFNTFNCAGFYKCNIKEIIWGASLLATKEWINSQKRGIKNEHRTH